MVGRDVAIRLISILRAELSVSEGTGGLEISELNVILSELESGKGNPQESLERARKIVAHAKEISH
jgi:hypothetical protein